MKNGRTLSAVRRAVKELGFKPAGRRLQRQTADVLQTVVIGRDCLDRLNLSLWLDIGFSPDPKPRGVYGDLVRHDVWNGELLLSELDTASDEAIAEVIEELVILRLKAAVSAFSSQASIASAVLSGEAERLGLDTFPAYRKSLGIAEPKGEWSFQGPLSFAEWSRYDESRREKHRV